MPKVLNNLDLAQNQLNNARIQNLATSPASPVEGQIYHNTVDHKTYVWNGSAWIDVMNQAPTGAAGGDLTGTYPNPTINSNAVTNAKLADMAASTLKGNNTAGTADPIDLTVAQTKALLAIAPSDVSGFDTQVRTSRLDQMAAPTVDVSLNSKKITSLADPVSAQDAATKNYVDNAIQGLDVKASVVAASTGNIADLSNIVPTIDGVALNAGDRVLIKNQTNAAQNGIYYYQAPRLSRATDANTWAKLPGAYVWVEGGSTYGDTGWVCTANAGGTLETTAVTWVQFSGAGTITASVPLLKNGNNIELALAPDGGLQVSPENELFVSVGSGLAVVINTIQVDPTLAVIADLTTAADRLPYFTGVDTAALATFTAAGRALVDDADAAAQRTTLGLGTMATQAASSVAITGGSVAGITDLAVADGGTGASTAATARANLGAVGKYSSATHGAGTTISIAAATHGLGTGRDKLVYLLEESTGKNVEADVTIAANGDVTVTFATSQGANTIRVTMAG